ncbi:MAG: hypothetical protein IJE07_10885 [Clostridia bacterium]|nr:hypothetical protein [Clostridia bacterium]
MKKVLSWILCAMLLLTAVAGLAEEVPSPDAGTAGDVADTVPSPDADAAAAAGGLVEIIDFEDGNYAFLGVDTTAGNADASALEVVDYNGSKALHVDVKAKVPYIALNLEGILGENFDKVRTITFDVGVELGSDGKFYAASGKVYTVTGADATKTGYDWSVYLKNKNPKTAKVTLKDVYFTAGQGEYLMFSKEADAFVDSDKFPGEEPRDIYLDNIQFFDAEGNVLPLDLSVIWEAPATEADLSNLSVLTNTVDLAGMTVEGGAWSQNGVEMNPEFLAALVPGSVVEISYESEDGDIWVVMPWSQAGWIRVAQGQATKNNSKTTAQITYEQFAALLGEDTSTWGAMFQCEGSSAWKVYSVKVGTPTAKIALTNKVEFAGFSCEGGAWGQNGFDFTQEVLDALQPGTALEINFESDSGDMWIVLPDAAAGWSRVQMMSAKVVGNNAYITYEQIVEVVGEDKAAWGARLQCEASGNWAVYAVNVGKVNEIVGLYDVVDFAGFSVSGGAWGQNGLEMTPEIIAALKPGCVITISYESDSGDMWLVFPDSAAGWMRVEMMSADCDGKTAQITWDELVAVLGEDVSTWGARMQCEASGNWQVYAVSVAQAQ